MHFHPKTINHKKKIIQSFPKPYTSRTMRSPCWKVPPINKKMGNNCSFLWQLCSLVQIQLNLLIVWKISSKFSWSQNWKKDSDPHLKCLSIFVILSMQIQAWVLFWVKVGRWVNEDTLFLCFESSKKNYNPPPSAFNTIKYTQFGKGVGEDIKCLVERG